MHARSASGGGKLLRLGQAASQRPLAVNVLAGPERVENQVAVGWHVDGDGDEIDRWVPQQGGRVCIACDAKCFGSSIGRVLAVGGDSGQFQAL